MNTFDDDNKVSIDIEIDQADSTPISIDVSVDTSMQKSPGRMDKLKSAASFIGSKAKAIKDADLFKSIDKLKAENPGYNFLVYKYFRQERVVRQTLTKTVYSPIETYGFYTTENDPLYSAHVEPLRKQNIQIIYNGDVISEIAENKRAFKKSSFHIYIKGVYQGELIRQSKEKGLEIFTFNNWQIHEKKTGYLEICSPDNLLIASWRKMRVKSIVQYWHQADEALIITLMIAINAYHNTISRQLNNGRPYYKDITVSGG